MTPTELNSQQVDPLFSAEEIVRINESLSKNLKVGDCKDFSSFNLAGRVLSAGSYNFSIEGQYLKLACQAARIVAGGSGSLIRVVVFSDKLKIASFNNMSFSEMFVPLSQDLHLQPGEEYSFVFDSLTMFRIAQYFEGVVNFTYTPEKRMLIVDTGASHLELPTHKETEFPNYHVKMQDPKYLGKIPKDVLKTGVKYIGKFVKRDMVQYNLSLAECRDGMLVGGTLSAVGIFQTDKLGDLAFGIRQEVLGATEKILGYVGEDTVYVFETDSFFIFRDSSLFFGVEKFSFTFPSIRPFLGFGNSEESLFFSKYSFFLSLNRLSILTLSEPFVYLRVSGVGDAASLTAFVKDQSGKVSKDAIRVTRKVKGEETGDWSDREFKVNLPDLLKVVANFEGEDMKLFEIKNKALAIVDPCTNYTTISVVALHQDKGSKQKASPQNSQLSNFVNKHILKR